MAQRLDFMNLPDAQQAGIAALIRTAAEHRISLRCEMVDGRDIVVIAGPGYASANYWADRFDLPH